MNENAIRATASTIPRSKDCPCCGHDSVIVGSVTLCAFVAERMTNTVQLDDWLTEAQQCEACGFLNTRMRFTDEQMQRYYHDYMLIQPKDGRQIGDYVFHRRRNEGADWFGLVELYNHPGWFAARKQAVFDTMKLVPDFQISEMKTVVDYGGDLGQYMPDEFKDADRYVVEVEPRKLVDGVKQISSPDQAAPADLLICCHTLEHVSWPRELLADMKRYVKPGGLLYLEVPNEDGYVINNNGKLKFHEHINIFFGESLHHFAVSNGLELLKTMDIPYNNVHKDFEPARAIVARMP